MQKYLNLIKIFIKLTQLFLILTFLTSWKKTLTQEELKKDFSDQKIEQLNKEKNKIEVKFSCGEDGITEFLNNG